MKPGRDYIGVGVGAMVFNDRGEVFLAQRGPKAGVSNLGKNWLMPSAGSFRKNMAWRS